jgi:hypothetical protein
LLGGKTHPTEVAETMIKAYSYYVTPFQGLRIFLLFTRGVAPGWYVVALSGLRKNVRLFKNAPHDRLMLMT